MTEYVATVKWERGDSKFTDNRYSRVHRWEFDGGVTVPASASPHVVRPPMASAEAVDPEEAFVAALSSCHMLWFLSIAAGRGFIVDGYVDHAVGTMGANAEGRIAMTKVILRPEVRFSGPSLPTREEAAEMHETAHNACFIANSVKTEVVVEARS